MVIAISSILAGEITTRTHIIRPVIWIGFGITSLGFGLFYACFTADVSIATQSGLLALCSFGVGFAISTPMLVIQAAMPPEDMAAATSAWILVRSFAATIGECHSCLSTDAQVWRSSQLSSTTASAPASSVSRGMARCSRSLRTPQAIMPSMTCPRDLFGELS